MASARVRRPLVAGLLASGVLGSSLLGSGAVGTAWASPGTVPAVSGDFRILDDRVTESSGLVLSRAHPHTVWTTNDSGDTARLFAVDTRTGRTVGVHTFGAPVVDVEALAITPAGRLLVADIGDNRRRREVVRIFWFDEPALGDTSGSWASWELSYPDGPHNAESVAVDPRSGRVLVVTKDAAGAVYALPAKPSRQGVNRLERLAAAPAVATDAVFLADGSALAVRTYTQLVLLDPTTWRPLASSPLPLQRQGETIALAPGTAGLLVGSEGSRSPVQQVAVPAVPAPTPTPSSPTPTPSSATPTPSSTTSGSSPGTVAQTPARSVPRSGTTTTLTLRKVVAGAAGAVALVLLALLGTRLVRRLARRSRVLERRTRP
ncbi:MAG: hypothetical protein WB473_00225 [Pedococcus sp.]